jgi:hypothetical protein
MVDVVFPGAGVIGAQSGQRRIGWLGGVDLRVDVERCLVSPELEHNQFVRIQGALKDFKWLAARFLLHGAAAVGHGLGELGALPWLGVRGDNETDRHGRLLSCGV